MLDPLGLAYNKVNPFFSLICFHLMMLYFGTRLRILTLGI
jgi:hypothetical protein